MVTGFVLDDWEIRMINRLSLFAAVFSTALCLFILIATLWVWTKKHARPMLDRISFRLFWWTMGFELAYDVAYIVGEAYTGTAYTAASCSAGIYLLMATMGVVNYLCTCIAINLMLIICFGVNPTKRKLERWYVGVSIGLGFFIPAVPTALGHFGHDPLLEVCWISAVDDAQRMLYLIVDLTIYSIFRLRRATSKAMFVSNTLNQSQSDSAGGQLTAFDDQFLKMALRISTYPVVMIIVNGLITGVDLYISNAGGVHSHTTYAFYCIYYFLYGGRGIFFALLGLFVDPCLRKGMRAAWRGPAGTYEPPVSVTVATEDITYKKSEINASLVPCVSYSHYTSNSVSDGNGESASEPTAGGLGRRESEIDVMAAITQIHPDPDPLRATEETMPMASGNTRGSRREVDGTVL